MVPGTKKITLGDPSVGALEIIVSQDGNSHKKCTMGVRALNQMIKSLLYQWGMLANNLCNFNFFLFT